MDYQDLELNAVQETIIQSLEEMGAQMEINNGYLITRGKDLKEYAEALRRVSGTSKEWSGKAIRNILNGHIEPGKEMLKAIFQLAAQLDGSSPVVVGVQEMLLYADPAMVRPGSVVLGRSKKCKYPPCSVWFIDDRREYCCSGCKVKNKNLLRRQRREKVNK